MESKPSRVEVFEEQIRGERQKARELRASYWWKRKRIGSTKGRSGNPGVTRGAAGARPMKRAGEGERA